MSCGSFFCISESGSQSSCLDMLRLDICGQDIADSLQKVVSGSVSRQHQTEPPPETSSALSCFRAASELQKGSAWPLTSPSPQRGAPNPSSSSRSAAIPAAVFHLVESNEVDGSHSLTKTLHSQVVQNLQSTGILSIPRLDLTGPTASQISRVLGSLFLTECQTEEELRRGTWTCLVEEVPVAEVPWLETARHTQDELRRRLDHLSV